MKKGIILLLFLACLGGQQQLFAQGHQKGDVLLSPGISFGNYHYYGDGFGVPLVLNVDFSPHDYASVGPYFGVFLRDNHTAFDVGARGTFHWWQLTDDKVNADLRADILDLYFSIYAGAEIENIHHHHPNDEPHDDPAYASRARAGAILGLRWYFAEPVALMFELGGPMGFSTIGFTFKL